MDAFCGSGSVSYGLERAGFQARPLCSDQSNASLPWLAGLAGCCSLAQACLPALPL